MRLGNARLSYQDIQIKRNYFVCVVDELITESLPLFEMFSTTTLEMSSSSNSQIELKFTYLGASMN